MSLPTVRDQNGNYSQYPRICKIKIGHFLISATLSLSRRQFLKAAAVSSALYALGCGSSSSSPGNGPFDVAVIGAGSAGIGAAQILQKAGTKFVIVEALGHIGGRSYSDNTTFPGIAFDLGAQWFHQVTPSGESPPNQTNNPLYNLAVAGGLSPIEDSNPRLLYNLPQPPVSFLESEAFPTLTGVAGGILSTGYEASLDPTADQSAAGATASLQGEPYYNFCWGGLATIHGASLSQMGCLDIYNLSLTAFVPPLLPSIDNYLLPTGMGNFITSLAAGMPVTLGTPVTAINWGGSGGVTLSTPNGTISARTAILTIPMGVLASGKPSFNPPLPAAYLNAIGSLPMGQVAKIGLLFKSDVFGTAPNTFALPFVNQQVEPMAQIKAWGNNFAVVIIGGPTIGQMEAQGQLITYALQALGSMFPEATQSNLVASEASAWNTSPYSMGAFTYAGAGNASARVTLGQPLADQLFFAGEAVSVYSHSTVHGAWETGQLAANLALAAL